MLRFKHLHLLIIVLALVSGCARKITSENADAANREQIAAFTPEDIEAAVGAWIADISAFGPVAASPEPVLTGFCGLVNRSMDPEIDMLQFERAFKYWGLRSGKLRFTSATDLPDGFFEQHKLQKSVVADKATASQIGKLQGWKYSIYGELFETRKPNAKGERILYYDVYVYMLNIESGEEVWNSRKQFKLRDTKPKVGW